MSGMSPFELSFRRSVKHHRIAPIGIVSDSPINSNDYDEAVTAMIELVSYLYNFGIIYNGIKISNLIKYNDKIYINNFKEVTFRNIDRLVPIDQLDIESMNYNYPVLYEKCLIWSLGKFIDDLYDGDLPAKYQLIVDRCLVSRIHRISMKKLSKLSNIKVDQPNNHISLNTYGMVTEYNDHYYFAQLWLVERIPSEIIILAIRLYWNYNILLKNVTSMPYIVVVLIMYATDLLCLRRHIKLDRLIKILGLNKDELLKFYKWLYINHLTHLPVHLFQVVIKRELMTLDTIAYLISQPQNFQKALRFVRQDLGLMYFNTIPPDVIYIPRCLRWLITNPTIYNYIES